VDDLPAILPHLEHADAVQGGLRLVSECSTLLSLEQVANERLRGRAPLSRSVREVRLPKARNGRQRVRRIAESAEAVRSLKASLGVPARPTNEPVDVWVRRERGAPGGSKP
jgi:hypothetical protein